MKKVLFSPKMPPVRASVTGDRVIPLFGGDSRFCSVWVPVFQKNRRGAVVITDRRAPALLYTVFCFFRLVQIKYC